MKIKYPDSCWEQPYIFLGSSGQGNKVARLMAHFSTEVSDLPASRGKEGEIRFSRPNKL